jgi:hypothetical protein
MTTRWELLSLSALLEFCRGRMSPRQVRLFACACVRRLPSARRGSSGEAIELAERFADGRATAHELANARYSGRFRPGHAAWAVCWSPDEDDWVMLERALAWATGFAAHSAHQFSFRREEVAQAELLRDIAGNLFEPAAFDPLWRVRNDSAVARLAEGIYLERAFDQMPILADALEEAGCPNERILTHCRLPGEHTRGCWVLDLALGRS